MAAEHLILEIIEGGKGRDEPPPGDGDGGGPEPTGALLSDNALALRFSGDVLRDDYLFVATERKWRRWDNRVWGREDTLLCQTWPEAL